MSKELLMGEPVIRNFQRDAYPMAVMAAHSDAYLPWVYSNSGQLMMNMTEYTEQNWYRVMHYNLFFAFESPFLTKIKMTRSYLQSFQYDIIDFIKSNIDHNYYFMLSIDKYYVPDTVTFQTSHFTHDTMIYGYDTDAFQIVGYGQMGKFEKHHLPFDMFLKAYEKPIVTDDWWNEFVFAFTYNQNAEYEFNKVLFKKLLEDYLSGCNTAAYTQGELQQTYKDQFIFGVNVYPYYKCYLESLLQENNFYDYTPIHLFTEHKQILSAAIKYLQKEKMIRPETDLHGLFKSKVEDEFVYFLKMFLKADIKKDRKYILRILDKFDMVLEAEKNILWNLYHLL